MQYVIDLITVGRRCREVGSVLFKHLIE